MKVLVVGSGGREHALAWALARAPSVEEVIVTPGNAGMGDVARVVADPGGDDALVDLARTEGVALVVIGPEAPLAAGLADRFRAAGLAVVGPGRDGARLEGSKVHAKAFMERHGVPTARHRSFADRAAALAYLDEVGAPVVVKDSSLAAGKGVTVAGTLDEARDAVEALFGRPGAEAVIEERLDGQEVSLLILTDGRSYRALRLAQDHKPLRDGDEGPMTGGMGTVAPAPLLDEAAFDAVLRTVVEPTLSGLREDGIDYRGVLFLGLMLTDGGVKVLEYNVRFGDPETQVVLPLLVNDLAEVLAATAEGRLHEVELRWRDAAAACVVMAAPGYPGSPERGAPLAIPPGLVRAHDDGGLVEVFHAGTRREGDALVSDGGRVLGVTAVAPTLAEAVARAYRAVDAIGFDGAQVRRDIGARLLAAAPDRPPTGDG